MIRKNRLFSITNRKLRPETTKNDSFSSIFGGSQANFRILCSKIKTESYSRLGHREAGRGPGTP